MLVMGTWEVMDLSENTRQQNAEGLSMILTDGRICAFLLLPFAWSALFEGDDAYSVLHT